MNKTPDFRPYVPTMAYPRVAAMHGRDAHAHGAAGLANPLPRDLLFTPWEKLYAEPFVGITTDRALDRSRGMIQRLDAAQLVAHNVEEQQRHLPVGHFVADAREFG